MSEKRINVGISESTHGQAAIAARIVKEDLQAFVTIAAADRAADVIKKFSVKNSRHSHRDTTAVTAK